MWAGSKFKMHYRSLPQALHLTDTQYVHVTVESHDNNLPVSNIILGFLKSTFHINMRLLDQLGL